MNAVPPATNAPNERYFLSAEGAWDAEELAFLVTMSVGFERYACLAAVRPTEAM